MFKSLDTVILYVNDVEKSKMFFQDMLGLSIDRDDGNYVTFKVNPQDRTCLAINLASTSGGYPAMQTIVLSTGDIENTYQKLQSKKVNIVVKLQNKSWGKTFTFTDIDGNKIEVVEG